MPYQQEPTQSVKNTLDSLNAIVGPGDDSRLIGMLAYLEKTMGSVNMPKFAKYVGEEAGFKGMPKSEFTGLLADAIRQLDIYLSLDGVEKIVIAAQQKFGLKPFDRFYGGDKDRSKHVKTVFEEFASKNQNQKVRFSNFTLLYAPENFFEKAIAQLSDTDGRQETIANVLKEARAQLPALYCEACTDSLRREFWYYKKANDMYLADQAKRAEIAKSKMNGTGTAVAGKNGTPLRMK